MEIWHQTPLEYSDGTNTGKKNKDRFSPFSENKNKEWYEHWANIYIGAYSNNWKVEEKYYRIFRGIRNDDDMLEIKEVYGNALPVPDIPHIPLIERFITHMVSVSTLRPLVYNIFTTDVDAIKESDRILIKEIAEEVTQKLSQSMQKEMENPEQKEQINQKLQEEIKKSTSRLSNFKIIQERIASKCMTLCMERLSLRDKWSTAFLDKLITGKQYYKCKLIRMGELPEYEIVNPKEIAFALENVDNLNECTFVVHRHYLSIQEVYTKYGHLLTTEDYNKLDKHSATYTTSTTSQRYFDNYESVSEDNIGYFGSTSTNLIEIYEIEWKVNREISVKELDGKLELLSESDGVLKDEEKITHRYYQELHTCVRINTDIYVKYGVVENARRNPNNISAVLLSYNGRLYNNRNNPPMSLVKELKDLGDRYDILWYKLFELIMLSGTKGVNIIKELLPQDMSVDEWFYYRKLGLSQFSISGEGAERLIGQIGQAITPFDDSLPANTVQSILMLLAQIEKTAGDICGVPPQALGQTQQYETKANTELAVSQGTITLEVLHKDHSEFIRQSLNDLLHYSKISLQEGDLKDYILTEQEQKANIIGWNFIDYGIEVVDSYTEEKNLRDVKQILAELVKSQTITADTMIKGMVSKSTNEVSKIIDEAVKEMKEAQQKNAEAQQQAESQKLQAETQIKQAELELKKQEVQARIKQDSEKLVQDIKIKEQEIDIKDRLAVVEEKYVDIEQQKISNDITNNSGRMASRQGSNKK